MIEILGGEMVEIPRKSVPHLLKSNPACAVENVVCGSSSKNKGPYLISFLLLPFIIIIIFKALSAFSLWYLLSTGSLQHQFRRLFRAHSMLFTALCLPFTVRVIFPLNQSVKLTPTTHSYHHSPHLSPFHSPSALSAVTCPSKCHISSHLISSHLHSKSKQPKAKLSSKCNCKINNMCTIFG